MFEFIWHSLVVVIMVCIIVILGSIAVQVAIQTLQAFRWIC